MANETKVAINFKNNVSGQTKIDKLAKSLKDVQMALYGIDKGTLSKVGSASNELKNVNNEAKNLDSGLKKAFDTSFVKKFTSALGNTLKVVKRLSNFTTVASDYYENWNLFQVAFKSGGQKAIDTANDFVKTMSYMYGLDESWGYKTTGIFKELASAMGVAEETGTKVSELMQQMSLDISSLYNVDIERASSVLQSSLAGLIISLACQLKKYLLKCWNTLKTLIPKCNNLKYVTMGNQQDYLTKRV